MVRKLFATDDSVAAAIPRLVLGVVFFAHGAQKMLGWFGGFGYGPALEGISAAHVAWPNAQKTKG